MTKKWTLAEMAILRRHYEQFTAKELARTYLPGRTYTAIHIQAGKMGLGRDKDPDRLERRARLRDFNRNSIKRMTT